MASTALSVIEGGKKPTEVIEVSTAQLTEHSKQAEYSPQMSKKKWREFVASVAKEGILQPIVVTKGFRVIDGKHRLKAAKELGIENVRVIIEEISEDKIPAYITATKLARDDLKSGQKAALVIRLFYEEERQKAKDRMLSGKSADPSETFQEGSGEVADILAKKVGVSSRYMYNLIAVYRNRPDLFDRVFSGEYSINKAYTQMKADEQPEEVEPTEAPIEVERKAVEALKVREAGLPQIDESQPTHSLDNRLVQMRKKALALTVEVLDESEKMSEAKPEVRDSARSQLLTLTRSCVLALGYTEENEDNADLLAVIHELLNKLNGGN